jgi:CheY-like chemotaxis protein
MTAEKRKPHQVLAIDDEAEILEVVRSTLTGEGYRVLTASNPRDGLALYEQQWQDIELVLLDYLMPDMTGDLVFEALQRINPDARVVLLTACDDQVARKMFGAGLRGYMQKPFYLDDLIRRVAEEIDAP